MRLIDASGENVGIVSIKVALDAAYEAGLDLIEISPNAEPPVCKVMDLGKYKYEAQKRKAEAKKNQKVVDVKEIKMRPNIDDHDYEVKLRSAKRFLDDGDKVKFTLRFRGREMAHQELGMEVLKRIEEDLLDLCKVELSPRLEGRQMVMMIAPK